MGATELDALRCWQDARRALAEGVAFLDGEGRVRDCDARFVELLGRMLDARLTSPEALTGQALAPHFADPALARVRALIEAELAPGDAARMLVPGRSFAVRVTPFSAPTQGRAVVLQELQTPTVDEDVAFLREQLDLRDQMLADQQRLISELLAPTIPVSPTLSVVPFVGPFHYDRVDEVLARLLDEVSEQGTRTLVVDLTGVSEFDASAATGLGRMVQTLALLGVRMVVTGVGVELALALSEDEGLPALEIHARLQDAIAAHVS